MQPTMRTIIEEEHVSSKLDKHAAQYPRVNDVWRGVEWLLARKPERGVFLDEFEGEDLYLFKSSIISTPNIPVITVLYKFNANEVTILDIKISLN